jgi:hypothetical protein
VEGFKQELFLEEYKRPIEFEPATEEDLLLVEKYLSILNTTNKEVMFFPKLEKHLIQNKQVNGLDSNDGLKELLYELELIEQVKVLVIWNYPGEIDKFNLSYLSKYWEDIWFSAADDAVCLFFPNINKAVLITHYNLVYY